MSKLLIVSLLFIISSLFILPKISLAQDTTCPITDSPSGQVELTNGKIIYQSTDYDCVDFHRSYKVYYKDESTNCEWLPYTSNADPTACLPTSGQPPTCTPGCPNGFHCSGGAGDVCLLNSTNPILPTEHCDFDHTNRNSTCHNGMICDATQFTPRGVGTCIVPPPIIPTCTDNPDSCQANDPNTRCTAPVFGQKRCTAIPPPSGPVVTGGGIECDKGGKDGSGISTAIGCIHTEPKALVTDLLKFAVGIGGGLAFLMMILGAFQMITSAGNPDTLHAGRDRFTSAIIGLLIIIFSVLLMQIIGFDILRLPGFGQ